MNTQPTPTLSIPCPACAESGRGHTLLVVRVNRKTGTEFLACPEWPECTYTQPIPESVLMRLAGQPTLFDTAAPQGETS
jgi:ssDNA-binding Zn-finger/Zn-ribbon topoisomerase 1